MAQELVWVGPSIPTRKPKTPSVRANQGVQERAALVSVFNKTYPNGSKKPVLSVTLYQPTAQFFGLFAGHSLTAALTQDGDLVLRKTAPGEPGYILCAQHQDKAGRDQLRGTACRSRVQIPVQQNWPFHVGDCFILRQSDMSLMPEGFMVMGLSECERTSAIRRNRNRKAPITAADEAAAVQAEQERAEAEERAAEKARVWGQAVERVLKLKNRICDVRTAVQEANRVATEQLDVLETALAVGCAGQDAAALHEMCDKVNREMLAILDNK